MLTPLKLATATRRRRPRPQAVLPLCVQESQIRRIFSTMINQKLEDFKEDVKPIGDILTQATLKLYSAVSAHFLPTPAKIHYLFNLRDISKVSGRLAVTVKAQKTVYYPDRLEGMLAKPVTTRRCSRVCCEPIPSSTTTRTTSPDCGSTSASGGRSSCLSHP